MEVAHRRYPSLFVAVAVRCSEYGNRPTAETARSFWMVHECAPRMQHLLVEANRLEVTVGTQGGVELAAGGGVMQIVTRFIPSTMSVWSWVDTRLETSNVVTTEVPKRVAVGVCRQAMRKYSSKKPNSLVCPCADRQRWGRRREWA